MFYFKILKKINDRIIYKELGIVKKITYLFLTSLISEVFMGRNNVSTFEIFFMDNEIEVVYLFQNILIVICLIKLYSTQLGNLKKYFLINLKFKSIIKSLLYIIVSTSLIVFIGKILGSTIDFQNILNYPSFGVLYKVIIRQIFVIAIIEEIVFRGIVFEEILSKINNKTLTIFITALIFVAIHFFPLLTAGKDLFNVIIYLFIGGIILGYVRLKEKNIIATIIIHTIVNIIS